jgi:hypothetical protein
MTQIDLTDTHFFPSFINQVQMSKCVSGGTLKIQKNLVSAGKQLHYGTMADGNSHGMCRYVWLGQSHTNVSYNFV